MERGGTRLSFFMFRSALLVRKCQGKERGLLASSDRDRERKGSGERGAEQRTHVSFSLPSRISSSSCLPDPQHAAYGMSSPPSRPRPLPRSPALFAQGAITLQFGSLDRALLPRGRRLPSPHPSESLPPPSLSRNVFFCFCRERKGGRMGAATAP